MRDNEKTGDLALTYTTRLANIHPLPYRLPLATCVNLSNSKSNWIIIIMIRRDRR